MCLVCFIKSFEEDFFRLIQSETLGESEEINEEWYDERVDRLFHQELDDEVNRFPFHEQLISAFGIHKALMVYYDQFGRVDIDPNVNFCKTLLYMIARDKVVITYQAFNEWEEKNPL